MFSYIISMSNFKAAAVRMQARDAGLMKLTYSFGFTILRLCVAKTI